jgi:orotidine-5'-phosphate decarboxylase
VNSPIILDIDEASPELWAAIRLVMPLPGVWGFKVGDLVLKHGISQMMYPGGEKFNMFVDLKHFDTIDRLVRIMREYAVLGEYAPTFITISGDACKAPHDLNKIIAVRGTCNIIVTGTLSSWSDDDCLDVYNMTAAAWQAHMHGRAFENDAQGITCPAWLLEDEVVQEDIIHTREQAGFYVIATGIRSEGIPAGNHAQPRTPEFALQHGATHVVIGSEVINAVDPVATLRSLALRCLADGPQALGQHVDKTV